MTEIEKGYIAGIIDGEGSILLTKHNARQHPCPAITIASTDLELLEWLKDTIGHGNISKKKNYDSEKHKPSFSYSLIRDSAIELLIKIASYLVIKKKRARAYHIINNYKSVTVRNGKYSPEQLQAKQQFYNDFMAL